MYSSESGRLSRLKHTFRMIFLTSLVSTTTVYAQPITDSEGDVGIGTNRPGASALLDLVSTSRGFLLPRMNSAQRSGIESPAEGLLIYNTDLGSLEVWSDVSGAFRWERILTPGTNDAWLTEGNAGLIPGETNIFGTLDEVALDIRTNDVTALLISGTDQSVAMSGRLGVAGDVQFDRDLNVDGTTTLDETTVDGTLDQTSGGQVRFSGNVDAENGLDVSGSDLNVATNGNVTGNVQVGGDLNVDGVTTLDETTVDGTLDQTGGGQVMFSGNIDAGNGADITGTLSLIGGSSPFNVDGSEGNSGDVLVSQGAGATPQWQTFEGLVAGQSWLLSGNADTAPGDEFLGTTDAQPLHIYVNSGSDNSLVLETNGSIHKGLGGDARGTDALDFQSARAASGQVASGQYSGIGGGENNTASGSHAAVSGGLGNSATGNNSAVLGGDNNRASGLNSSVGGGVGNVAGGIRSHVGGGWNNSAAGNNSVVAAGLGNQTLAAEATVSGGLENTASQDWATVSGGRDNRATGISSTVSGGRSNLASGINSAVGGGDANQSTGLNSSIAGGVENHATGSRSHVGGGWANRSEGLSSVVSGGTQNSVSGDYAVIGGGLTNNVTAAHSVIAGGCVNTITGTNSSIVGGRDLTLNGNYSLGFLSPRNGVSPWPMRVDESHMVVFGNTDLWLANNDTTASQMRFFEAATDSGAFPATGVFYTSFEAPALADTIEYILPAGKPLPGQYLVATSVSGDRVTLAWDDAFFPESFADAADETVVWDRPVESALTLSSGSASDLQSELKKRDEKIERLEGRLQEMESRVNDMDALRHELRVLRQQLQSGQLQESVSGAHPAN